MPGSHAFACAPARILRSAPWACCLLSAFLGWAAPAEPAGDAPAKGDAPPPELAAPATNVLAAVAARLAPVTNASCTVRRSFRMADDDEGKTLSRISWARGGFLNVQALRPERRRTVVDGREAWSGPDEPGARAAAVRPLAAQTPLQAANLFSVPGSPEERLAALDPASAEEIVPAAAPFARQIAFRPLASVAALSRSRGGAARPEPPSTIVSFDAAGRVAALEVFADASRMRLLLEVAYEAPFEALPGVWLFRRECVRTAVGGKSVETVTAFDRFRVNAPPPPGAFDPHSFFPGGAP